MHVLTRRIALCAIAAIVVAGGLTALSAAHRGGDGHCRSPFLDPLAEVVLPLLFGEATNYAPRFSEERFQSLQPGMSPTEVERLLGKPLHARRFADGRTMSYYSQQRTERDNYRVRIVVFDRDERLIRRRTGFYLD